MATEYKELEAASAKFTDEELLAEMKKHALALTVLWREAESREQPDLVPIAGHPMMEDRRHGKNLFVSVYLTDRRGVHISAIEGRRIAGM